jgi:hypothetical protein
MSIESNRSASQGDGPPPADISGAAPTLQEDKKWGVALRAGFQQVPDVLLKNQARLGLAPLELVVLLNLTLHWWKHDNLPYPTINTIAQRIGVGRRTVERALKQLEQRGLVMRARYERLDDGRVIRRFDLSGLVAKLQTLARRDRAFFARRSNYPASTNLAVTGSTLVAGP